jgi:hypothetical protein
MDRHGTLFFVHTYGMELRRIDSYGFPVFNTPKKEVEDPHGTKNNTRRNKYWDNEVEGLKSDQDSLNEFYRQFPHYNKRRDESRTFLILQEIYEQ